MSLEKYNDIVKQDIIEPVIKLIQNGTYRFTQSGRLEADYRMQSETPWIHVRQGNQNCALWHQVWFDYYGFIPSYCQQCWKVVVRPTTLKELFMLHDIQVEIDRPSKCGIEKRYSVNALYGGYFYNTSLEDGLQCKKEVEAILHERLGPHIKVFLKRACTEFEHKFGDSRNWQVTPEQINLEHRLEDLFVDLTQRNIQGDEQRRHVMANWVRFAYANGDQTARDFMSEPLYPAYVIYKEQAE